MVVLRVPGTTVLNDPLSLHSGADMFSAGTVPSISEISHGLLGCSGSCREFSEQAFRPANRRGSWRSSGTEAIWPAGGATSILGVLSTLPPSSPHVSSELLRLFLSASTLPAPSPLLKEQPEKSFSETSLTVSLHWLTSFSDSTSLRVTTGPSISRS